MLDRVVVPARLALIYRAGRTLGYNPGLNTWEPLEEDTAEALRWLRAGRERGALAAHLARRFDSSLPAAAKRLQRLLGWCILHRMLYLDAEPRLSAIDHGPNPLDTVYWICTQACNLRCTYCYQDATVARREELSTAEARDLIEQTAEAGASTFIFTGGEPFVRRDLLELARFSRSRGLRTNVITNGHYVTPSNVDEIAAVFHNVSISIDGTMEHHDRSRGRGSWGRAVHAVELLTGAGVNVDVNSVLTKFALADVEELLRLVRSWNVGEHRIVPQFPMGRGGTSRDEELTEEELLQIGDRLYQAARELPGEARASMSAEGSYTTRMTRRNHCGAGLSEVSVDPEGWVYPCKLLQYPQFKTENVRRQRLTAIFAEHPTLRATRARTAETLHPCRTCIIKNHCGGGCRGIHVSFTNDYIRAHPLFCAYLRHTFEVAAWSSTGAVPPTGRVKVHGAPAIPPGNFIPVSEVALRGRR
jgi:radical SAM protein with 4Fe4S-binding SPASM domain